jgi:hypothetical protein
MMYNPGTGTAGDPSSSTLYDDELLFRVPGCSVCRLAADVGPRFSLLLLSKVAATIYSPEQPDRAPITTSVAAHHV